MNVSPFVQYHKHCPANSNTAACEEKTPISRQPADLLSPIPPRRGETTFFAPNLIKKHPKSNFIRIFAPAFRKVGKLRSKKSIARLSLYLKSANFKREG